MSDRKESGGNTISRDDLTAKIVERLEEIEELSDMQICKAFVDKNIPLIKHAGFREEDEYRLLICNTQAEFRSMVPCPLDSYVEYLPENNVQRPILTLHFDGGGSGKVDGDVTVRLRLCNIKAEEEKELKYQLKGKLKDQNGEEIGCRLEYVTEKWGEQPQIIIGRADDSLQRNVFEAIDRVLTAGAACEDKKMFQGVKLWCEGHLPVRSIRVSPCENQEDVVESIRHYCVHHKYWLKYVDVTGSEIPYRRPK